MNSNLVVRLALTGCVLICAIIVFGYVGGWWSPQRLTQDRMAAAFLQINGPHPGFRLIIAAAVLTVLRHREFSHLVPLSVFVAVIALARISF